MALPAPPNESTRLAEFSLVVRESTLKRLRAVPDGFENWRAVPSSSSFAEHAFHLLVCDKYLIDRIHGEHPPIIDGIDTVPQITTRVEFLSAIDRLAAGGDERAEVIRGLEPLALTKTILDDRFKGEITLWWLIVRGCLDHETHHRGQIIANLRIAGIAGGTVA